MSEATVYLWRDEGLEARDDCDILPASIEAADSWLVDDGRVRGLELHRTRFMTSIPRGRYRQLDPGAFWTASLAATPRSGRWFPRFELRTQLLRPQLLFRLRDAPEQRRSIVLVTHEPDIAAHARRVVVLRDGLIASDERKEHFVEKIMAKQLHQQH